MSPNYQHIQQPNTRRRSASSSIFLVEEEQNSARRLPTISQIHLPNGSEYHPQQQFLVKGVEGSDKHRLSINSRVYHPLEEGFIETKTKEHRRILFIVEPIIIGLILFPIIILFWQCGWNVVLILLNLINGYPLPVSQQFVETEESTNLADSLSPFVSRKSGDKGYSSKFDKQSSTELPNRSQTRHKKLKGLGRPSPFLIENHDPSISNFEGGDYSIQSLVIPYVIVQIFLLCLYLGQDFIYNFLKKQNNVIKMILLKCHIFFLASIYIVQWEMIWTIWDQYTPNESYAGLLFSLTCLFALIAFTGDLSDLVSAPFLVSYDSIEYCLQFGCALLTRQMKRWKINLINFVLYEIIISNITIIVWRGFYHFLDKYFYPDDWIRSAWFCILIGYILYFPLMYFQNYLEDFNSKYEFWTLVSMNFPQFYPNVRHLLAFCSCLFLWRGLWLLYDSYINIFESYYQTYLLLYILSFIFLALIQTASSTNGPLSNMEDENRFFSLYSNCYVSTVVRKFSQLPFFRSENAKEDIKP